MVVVTGKLKNPGETANIFSYFTFLWFLPTILKGYKRPLNENDLFDVLDEYRAKKLGDQIEEVWEKEETKYNPSLMRVVLRTVGMKGIILYALGGNVLDFIKISQIVILIRLLENLSSPEINDTIQRNIYMYATLLVLCSIIVATTQHLYTFGSKLIGMKVRLALCSILYRKALKLSKRSFGGAVGPLLNMLGNDVSRFDLFAISLNHIFSPPLHIATILTIVYFEVGWTGCVGVGIILSFIPLQVIWGKMLIRYKQRIAHRADQRVHVTNEIISGMQVIKMYAWESFFSNLISKIRNIEIKLLRYNYILTSITGSIYQVIPQLPLLSAVLLYIAIGNSINPGYIYALVACYNILKASILSYLPNAILTFADTKVAVNRFESYLWSEEVPVPKLPKETYIPLGTKADQSNIGVSLEKACAAWGNEENTLEDISMDIPNSKLIAIVGPVGSGKSSLLNVILKELPLVTGKIAVNGSISYASQEPWLFLGTIRANILFGQPYNEETYKKVIKMCALERDLSLFANGDLAIVRERGSNLSGGQKSRINLARAIYKQADIYIIDDPLAAVDVHVAKYIFENCITGYLKEKCVILVTNHLQLLKSVDYVYILKNGRVIDEGTYPGLKQKQVFKDCEENDHEKAPIDAGFVYSDSVDEIDSQEVQNFGKVSLKLYRTYFKGGGGFIVRALLILILLLYHCLVPINNLFISHWSNVDKELSSGNNTTNETIFTRENYIIFFMGIAGSLFLSSVVYAMSFFLFFVQCNKSIHQKVFSKVINAPMQFFSLNPSGRILNRFARDLGIVDNNIAIAIFDVTNITMQVIQIMVMVIIANAWLSPAVVIVLVSTYLIRMIYLPACVSIKRIEGILRSPIFTFMKGTLEGLATIRASGEQAAMKTTFEGLLDSHTSTWYMYLASTHTFGIAIDTLCALFLAIVTLSFVIPGQDIPASRAGLAITESLVLIENVQWMMRQWNELTTNMTSIERLAEYLDIEQEGSKDDRNLVPQKPWGERGSIEFKNVNLKYSPWSKPVLKNINFQINQFQKIGIVGRTGAGKSSLSTALFQLAFTEGAILIDGVDISKIPLNTLRTKLSIIPQEPVLFTATLRENLDPFEEYDDSYIWQVLSEVELMKVVSELPSGLETNISVGGANFSVGQRQLLCLARAILKRTKILIIDEATANVDAETDALIQKTIRRKFEDCTVLTIAHRLNTIIDSHKVMVLHGGEIQEFDSPLKLLENKGMFHDMIQKTGDGLASNLHRTAEVAHRRNASP